ncbi:uncharacterized protein LOC126832142 [Patella vulgata]|uniref:uncharacterized protein LOC126832142 n=1 Tax=Patella vulgata TaxID=6465 RepID=UPI00217FA4A1|nr:uncharacterized protein LOC126832142 [Patella vulgata]
MVCHIWFDLVLIVVMSEVLNTKATNENQICHFYKYNADCLYKLDGVSMVNIKASVNECNDPIDVTFSVLSDTPPVDWTHTFSDATDTQLIAGFDKETQLEVLLSFDNDQNIQVTAHFMVENQQKVSNFIDEKVHLTALEDCTGINKAGQIAVGCLIALLIIAGILLVILLYYRHRRRVQERQNQVLVENIESPCDPDCSTCQPATVRFNAQSANQSSTNQNLSSGLVTLVLSNGHAEGSSNSLPV